MPPDRRGRSRSLTTLLTRGFARTGRDYWIRGFSRWRLLPAVEEMPRYGYVLDSEVGPVGAVLLISSQRGGRIVCNVSGWYVDPAWRVHSPMLISVATRLRHVTYVAATPAPNIWRTLQTQGFKPYNFGRSAVFSWPGKGFVTAAIPDDLPEARLLRDHRDMGAISVTVEKDGQVSPFVFKPRRLDTTAIKMMELIYCRDTADFRRCARPSPSISSSAACWVSWSMAAPRAFPRATWKARSPATTRARRRRR